LGYKFNQPVDILPKNVKFLYFKNKFNQSINNIPDSVSHLILGCGYSANINKFPLSLTHLTIRSPINNINIQFPKTLVEIGLCYLFNYEKNISGFTNIKTIKLYVPNFCYNQIAKNKLTNFPSSVKKIEINYSPAVKYIYKIPFGCVLSTFMSKSRSWNNPFENFDQ
jgi:hypothetical protein